MCNIFFLKTEVKVLNLIAELDLERPPGLSSEGVGVGVGVGDFACLRVETSVVILGGRWAMVDAFGVGTLDHHCLAE